MLLAGRTVDAYVATLPDWQAELVGELRRIMRAAAPEATEALKWAQPVYERNGPFAWIKGHRDHVNIGFWRGIELADPEGLLDGEGERMRHLGLRDGDPVPEATLIAWIREAVELNERLGDPTRRGGA
ncbi:MAG: DUF1801 domain-containing protein [Candidatus Limnocylindrales bacterium]